MSRKPQTSPPRLGRLRQWWSRHGITVIVVVISLGAVGSIGAFMKKRDTAQPPKPIAPTPVTVLTIKEIPQADDIVAISGLIEPNRVVNVSAESAARIERYAGKADKFTKELEIIPGPTSAGQFKEGDHIQTGQPIMYLNTDLVSATLAQAKAEYEFRKRDWQRVEKLRASNVSTASELDQVRWAYDLALAVLRTAKANMERSVVLAPISGCLNRLPVEVGEYVKPGDLVAEVVDLSVAKVVLDVAERDVPFLKLGQQQEITCGLVNPQRFSGKITYISDLADPSTLTTRVEVSIPNKNAKLRSGQIVKTHLKLRTLTNVIMIPLDALIPLEKGYLAWVNNNGKAEKRFINVDPSFIKGQSIRIINAKDPALGDDVKQGLQLGDELILRGNRLLGQGQSIRVMERDSKSVKAKNENSKSRRRKTDETATQTGSKTKSEPAGNDGSVK